MAWEENSRICLHMQLIAILSRIGVLLQKKQKQAKPVFNPNEQQPVIKTGKTRYKNKTSNNPFKKHSL